MTAEFFALKGMFLAYIGRYDQSKSDVFARSGAYIFSYIETGTNIPSDKAFVNF